MPAGLAAAMAHSNVQSDAPSVRTRDGLVRLKARARRADWVEEASWFVLCVAAGVTALAVAWVLAGLG
jgi:hypothetical protein